MTSRARSGKRAAIFPNSEMCSMLSVPERIDVAILSALLLFSSNSSRGIVQRCTHVAQLLRQILERKLDLVAEQAARAGHIMGHAAGADIFLEDTAIQHIQRHEGRHAKLPGFQNNILSVQIVGRVRAAPN